MPEMNHMAGLRNPNAEKVCPYFKAPHPECYCVDMDDLKTNLALRFCRNDYTQCRIYKKLSRETVNGRKPQRSGVAPA